MSRMVFQIRAKTEIHASYIADLTAVILQLYCRSYLAASVMTTKLVSLEKLIPAGHDESDRIGMY